MSNKPKIILATGNKGKAEEIRDMLDGKFDVRTMAEVGIDCDIVEDGKTFEENALIKVQTIRPLVREKGEKDVILMADDSGLCVDALDGAPGIFSARYAGEHVTYDDNNQKLLKALSDVPVDKRGAQFVCAVALIFPDGEIWTGRGTVDGTISDHLIGTDGFGYDPLFVENSTGKSFAEMGEEQKNTLSHRYKAVKQVAEKLKDKLGDQVGGDIKRIGVVSDSHGNIMNLQDAILAMGDIDAIFHLGDYVRDAKKMNVWTHAPAYWIRGNCDMGDSEGIELAKIRIGGKLIMACHGHRFGVKTDLTPLKYNAKQAGADIVLFGHTHHAYQEVDDDGMLILNPGALIGGAYSDKPSYAVVTIDADGNVSAEINTLE